MQIKFRRVTRDCDLGRNEGGVELFEIMPELAQRNKMNWYAKSKW
jgi:hypothetical protein